MFFLYFAAKIMIRKTVKFNSHLNRPTTTTWNIRTSKLHRQEPTIAHGLSSSVASKTTTGGAVMYIQRRQRSDKEEEALIEDNGPTVARRSMKLLSAKSSTPSGILGWKRGGRYAASVMDISSSYILLVLLEPGHDSSGIEEDAPTVMSWSYCD